MGDTFITPAPATDLGLRWFQAASVDRAQEWHRDAPWSLSDWMVATMGELGEAANVIKKLMRHRDGIATERDPSEADLMTELRTELADTLSYLVLVADAAGVDLAGATVEKFNIVSERQGWPHHWLDPLTPSRIAS